MPRPALSIVSSKDAVKERKPCRTFFTIDGFIEGRQKALMMVSLKDTGGNKDHQPLKLYQFGIGEHV